MQTGQSSFAPDATHAAVSVPYFQPNTGGGGLPPGNITIDGSLLVTQSVVIDQDLTVDSGIINLVGDNAINGSGAALIITSGDYIGLVPAPGQSVACEGDVISTGNLVAALAGPKVEIAGAGIATIPNSSTFITVPFAGMTVTGKVLATITGNFNGVTALSVVPSVGEFSIYAPGIPSAPTNVMWMVIGLA